MVAAKNSSGPGRKIGVVVGRVLTALGLVLVLAALTLAGYNWQESAAAGAQSEHALSVMRTQLPEERAGAGGVSVSMGGSEIPEDEIEMATTQIDGWSYVGRIDIPRIGITLPVLATWTEAGANIAPCRYKGSVYNGTMIIAAHNFASHFGNLYQLADGDTVNFVDVNGNAYHYVVMTAETIDGYDILGMEEGEWDLTLFTCNFSGAQRTTVRCARV